MGFRFLRGAEEFIDVAFPIPNMNASLRLIQERGRLLQVLQPADAFLLFNRNPCRINLLFERVASLKLLIGQKNSWVSSGSGSLPSE